MLYSEEDWRRALEERTTPLATYDDPRSEYAFNAGMDRPDRPRILTDWDTWEPNPHYTGPAVPHPEER